MKSTAKPIIGSLLVVCLIAAGWLLPTSLTATAEKRVSSTAEPQRNVIRARAILLGAPGSDISGEVTFTQAPADKNSPEPTVEVVARVEGLSPGLHAIHIHEVGSCVPPTFASAGGHFDPGPAGNSTPVDVNHPFHTGDLPNLVVNEAGVGHLRATTSRITLFPAPSPLSVFDINDSAVVVHLLPDLGNPTFPVPNPPGSGVAGGARLACGIIEWPTQE